MKLTVENRHDKYRLTQEKCRKLINYLQEKEDVDIERMAIIVSTDEHLNQLKKEFYNQDVLTDTISFNLNKNIEPVEGEIYLSVDRIKENAHKFDNSFEYEFTNVLVHSILHTFGYEDDTQAKQDQMFKLQKNYLQDINHDQLINKKN